MQVMPQMQFSNNNFSGGNSFAAGSNFNTMAGNHMGGFQTSEDEFINPMMGGATNSPQLSVYGGAYPSLEGGEANNSTMLPQNSSGSNQFLIKTQAVDLFQQ